MCIIFNNICSTKNIERPSIRSLATPSSRSRRMRFGACAACACGTLGACVPRRFGAAPGWRGWAVGRRAWAVGGRRWLVHVGTLPDADECFQPHGQLLLLRLWQRTPGTNRLALPKGLRDQEIVAYIHYGIHYLTIKESKIEAGSR